MNWVAPSFAFFAKEPALSAVEEWGITIACTRGVKDQCPTSRKTPEKWGTLVFVSGEAGHPSECPMVIGCPVLAAFFAGGRGL